MGKFVPGPSEIEARGLPNGSWGPPKHNFYTKSISRRPKGNSDKFFGSQDGQLGSNLEAQEAPKSRPKPEKIEVKKQHVFGIDF